MEKKKHALLKKHSEKERTAKLIISFEGQLNFDSYTFDIY